MRGTRERNFEDFGFYEIISDPLRFRLIISDGYAGSSYDDGLNEVSFSWLVSMALAVPDEARSTI